MKRFFVFMMAIVMVAAFACCDSKTPEQTTTEADVTTEAPETTTEAPTEAPTEEPTTEEEVTIPETSEQTTVAWTEPENAPYDVLDAPVINPLDDRILHGYHASGEFNLEDACALSTKENSMFIVTNDRLASGKITATFTAPAQYINDNGIIFGMEEDVNEQYYFWEDGPTYYFLFVSDDATLYLAKVGYDGEPWTELQVSAPIENYQHGDMITISVELDGEGSIDCYANDECLIYYYDDDWSGGSRYGIRCEVPGVLYSEVIADHSWVPDWK
ncbi:MAG: hypothetical protein IIU63_05080 [Clostridia bacterium]|nr:hypothetical protein [Clostridia bacterium]MBQ5362704.1 hypothetical protein [Clostridia bacterium]